MKWEQGSTGSSWNKAGCRAHAKEQALWTPTWHGEGEGRKVSAADHRGKAGVTTTAGNSFSMNSQTRAFQGWNPTFLNQWIYSRSFLLRFRRTNTSSQGPKYHRGRPPGFLSRDSPIAQEAQQLSPSPIEQRGDSAHRHAQRHLFLLNKWHSQWESKMKEHRQETELPDIRPELGPNHLDEEPDLGPQWARSPTEWAGAIPIVSRKDNRRCELKFTASSPAT